jgi:subtilisin family serine protease
MDVVFKSFCLVVFLALGACGPTNTPDQVFKDNSLMKVDGTCQSAVLKDDFIVRWKDGSISREQSQDLETFKKEFISSHLDEIDFAEYNVTVQIQNDFRHEQRIETSSASQAEWGQTMVEASSVWTQGYRGQGILVGVVDTQVEFTHPQLSQRSYKANATGGDPWGRGNFTSQRLCNPEVDNQCALHGTHVAGIIAAEHGSGSMRGLAPQAKIIGSGFLDVNGSGTLADAISALRYAEQAGAQIINASWGADNCSYSVRDEFVRLSAKGILLVVAAGNGDVFGNGYDIFKRPVSPASFNLTNQLTVAASTRYDFMTSFSNFSFDIVHLAAPGEDILSTVPSAAGNYKYLSGTSMAAPFVSGAAAVLWSARPQATATQIKQALLQSVDVSSGHEFQVSTRGRLNLRKALQKLFAMP